MAPDDPRGRESEVLGSLPSTRPQRRSEKRSATKARAASSGAAGGTTAKPRTKQRRTKAATKPRVARPAARKPAPAKPRTTAGRRPTAVRPSAATKNAGSTTDSGPARPNEAPPGPPQGIAVVGTAVQAAGELVELGVSLGSQAVRAALRRIPRP